MQYIVETSVMDCEIKDYHVQRCVTMKWKLLPLAEPYQLVYQW